jgi:NSS family neurotransmitter:Na+ symporter
LVVIVLAIFIKGFKGPGIQVTQLDFSNPISGYQKGVFKMDGREQWKSQFGFLLAAVGSAVGLGNIWRFSYMAYDNGGGAYLIPYITALLTAGIPLLILEFGIGHERVGSAPLAYAKLNKKWEWLGWWAVIFVMFGIELYYTTIISWCLNFFVQSFNLGWGEDTKSFFYNDFLKLSSIPSEILFRGVQRGIELANKIFMPLLLLLTAVLVFWSLSLDGAMVGVKAYLTPDFSKLTDTKVWIDAYGQIFFTLSLGFGIMIAYASYLPDKTNITKNAILTGVINSGYSLFAGFAVFSVLGFMATTEGKAVSEVVDKSIGLAFIAYPKAISMIPGGKLFGAIFFLCLFVAGMSSSISIMEAFTAALIDKFGYNRKKVVTIISILGFLGSIIFATRAGLLWLDIVDHFLNNYGLIVVGLFECIVVAWIFKLKVIKDHINKISSIKLGLWWDMLIKYFIPLVLCIILIGSLRDELSEPYEGYSWLALIVIGRDWVLLTLVAAFWFAMRPWKTDQLKASGRGL